MIFLIIYLISAVLAPLSYLLVDYIEESVIYEENHTKNSESLVFMSLMPILNTLMPFIALGYIVYCSSYNKFIFSKRKLLKHPENNSLLKLIKIYRFYNSQETKSELWYELSQTIQTLRKEKNPIKKNSQAFVLMSFDSVLTDILSELEKSPSFVFTKTLLEESESTLQLFLEKINNPLDVKNQQKILLDFKSNLNKQTKELKRIV